MYFICVVLYIVIVLSYVLFVCKCVLYYCYRVWTQLQLTDLSKSIKQIFFTILNDILSSFTDKNGHIFVIFSQKEYPEKWMIELFHFHVLTTVVITVVETDQWLFLTDSANFASNDFIFMYIPCIFIVYYLLFLPYIYIEQINNNETCNDSVSRNML